MINKDTLQMKVIDLGSATLYTLTLPQFDGTKVFAPPEAFFGELGMLEQREIWAMGCLLYSLIFNRYPFYRRRETVGQELVFPKIKWTSTKPVSKDVKTLITAMLDKNPMTRATLDNVKTSPFLNRRSRFGF
jgi:serine/threonine protein kinase